MWGVPYLVSDVEYSLTLISLLLFPCCFFVEGVVKMRRGHTAAIFARCAEMSDVESHLEGFLTDIHGKMTAEVAVRYNKLLARLWVK